MFSRKRRKMHSRHLGRTLAPSSDELMRFRGLSKKKLNTYIHKQYALIKIIALIFKLISVFIKLIFFIPSKLIKGWQKLSTFQIRENKLRNYLDENLKLKEIMFCAIPLFYELILCQRRCQRAKIWKRYLLLNHFRWYFFLPSLLPSYFIRLAPSAKLTAELRYGEISNYNL